MKKQLMTKRNLKSRLINISILAAIASAANANADEAKNTGDFYGNFNLRYESVQQDNALEDADALTLRTRLGYKTKTVNGFSALIEGEATTEIVDNYSVPPAGVRPGEFSVIADPESQEIDQAFIQYSNKSVTAKLGRQVITLDGHRFVGHVGWRQDRQTFDAATVTFKPSKGFSLHASYIDKRNRIFAQEADIDSKDILLNSSYKTPVGKLTAYAYLLEVDNNTDNSLDTYGVSFKGSRKSNDLNFLYAAEYATQDTNDQFDTDYIFLEGGVGFSGITAKLGYEVLGSDDGQRGFATPLATLHKFNGWADVFLGTPSQGLKDLILTLSGKAAGGKWAFAYHDFSSDTSLAGADDLGSELNLVYTRKINKAVSGGVKLASYSAGDAAFQKVDTDKLWIWAGTKF